MRFRHTSTQSPTPSLRPVRQERRARHAPRGRCARAPFVAALAAAGAASLVASPAASQGRLLHVDRFTTEQGLAQNTVSAVVQDSAGYIWVATPRGLQRFDGYAFVQYTSLDPRAPSELAGHIHTVRVDSRGNRWIATPQSLFRLSAHRLALTRVHQGGSTARFVMDAAGRLWFLEGSALKWVETNAEQPGAVTALTDSSLTSCWTLAAARRGALWLGCQRDSVLFAMNVDPATKRMSRFALESLTAVLTGFEDHEGRMWIGGDRGLMVLDPGRDRFRMVEAFRGVFVPAIEPDRGASLLIPTDRWLARVDFAGRVIDRWDPREVFADAPLPRDLDVDREGAFWIATTTAGLVRLDPTRPVFDHLSTTSSPPLPVPSNFVMALYETRDGSLWGGTLRAGVFRASPDGSRLDGFRHDPRRTNSLATDEVWDFEEDRAGNLWVGTAHGICRAALPDFICYRPPGAANILDIAKDRDGIFWIARGSVGVMSFDPATATFGPSARQPPLAVSVYADRDSGFLWIGGEQLFRGRVGNGRLALPLDSFSIAPSPNPVILDLHRTAEGVLWLASEAGLQRWDVANRRFVPVSIPELSTTTVFSIEEDGQGRLWLGTAHGIVEYSPSTGIARRYRRPDGVMSGEFNRRAALRRRNGEMVFGGIDGLTIFRPELVTRRRQPPPVVVTRWRRVTSRGPVDASLDGVADVQLGPGDRTFTLDFAALTFAPGPARRYRYRLRGLSEDWIESADHSVTYATPPPGRYTFEVQTAAGTDGAWAEPGKSLGIGVVPPFWGTSWFRTLLVAALMTLLWALHRLRLRQAVAVERLRLQISRDLHDEIGAGLSSIALISDAVAASGNGDGGRAQLARIGQSARGMVADLRDIVWAIDPNADRLEDIASRMQDVSGDLLPGIPIAFRAPPPEHLSGTVGLAERKELLLIYKELLHNVARHARAGSVRIELNARGGEIELVVADDGRGFDPSSARAGRGLRSIRERAERLGARFDVESRPGGGTTATLALRRT